MVWKERENRISNLYQSFDNSKETSFCLSVCIFPKYLIFAIFVPEKDLIVNAEITSLYFIQQLISEVLEESQKDCIT